MDHAGLSSPGARSIHDPAYLRANVRGGEGFDWFYASDGAIARAQIRTPITDGARQALGVPFQGYRGLVGESRITIGRAVWRAATPTAWVPQSKPFWLTEIGCPAVDKGANQPNVFVDPKSSENALPYFSRGTRDDLIQRRTIDAMISSVRSGRSGFRHQPPIRSRRCTAGGW